jgi:ribosomal protein S18 acetylase RimI-like enzyme
MIADKTDLNFSVGVFDKGNLIAFLLHGFDNINNQKEVYNGGTGVIPNKRGAGLTKKMYHFILPQLLEKGINKIVLEVINENIQAIKSYEQIGFKTKRELVCYKGIVETLKTNKNVDIKDLKKYNWKLMESFWDILPTWQNSKNVIDRFILDNISLGAYIENQLVGYVIYNPNNNRIQQIAVKKDFRKKRIASTLISKLTTKYGKTISIINVDKKSESINHFFCEIGLKNNLAQLEMELDLNENIANIDK